MQVRMLRVMKAPGWEAPVGGGGGGSEVPGDVCVSPALQGTGGQVQTCDTHLVAAAGCHGVGTQDHPNTLPWAGARQLLPQTASTHSWAPPPLAATPWAGTVVLGCTGTCCFTAGFGGGPGRAVGHPTPC